MIGSNSIMVSVCMITYNHETYIKDAIEGVLMQKTNFPIELIIGEDCSTDNTRDICIEYQQKYPDIIKLRLPEKNLGVMPNFIETLIAGSGKYIAICEGDDYWTDSLKLQKQVDFMESNEQYSFCFHNALVHNIYTDKYRDFNKDLKSKIYNTKHLLLNDWFVPTASILFRKSSLPNSLPWWYYHVYHGDYGLQLILSVKGDFYYFNEKMSVYRLNSINSLSVSGPNGIVLTKKKLFLLNNFKSINLNKYILANYLSILYVRYVLIKVYLYHFFPFIVKLNSILFHHKKETEMK